jgi:putative chitinase
MAIDRKTFFDGVRSSPFSGKLNTSQVKGMTAILDAWDDSGLTDLRWLAYMFATVLAECGPQMLPVREGFKKTDAQARAYVKSRGYAYAVVVNGQVYYGRGLVQLTWEKNYEKMGELLDKDLVNDPDQALEPDIAAEIMFKGMTLGTFTGKKLSDYFNDDVTDWIQARRIINKLDRAGEIAGYAKQFHSDLVMASGLAAAWRNRAPRPRSQALSRSLQKPRRGRMTSRSIRVLTRCAICRNATRRGGRSH